MNTNDVLGPSGAMDAARALPTTRSRAGASRRVKSTVAVGAPLVLCAAPRPSPHYPP